MIFVMVMDEKLNYLKLNKETWNLKTEVHVESEFYNNEAFVNGKSSLNSIELDLLKGVKGKSILHLQCHFGQDSLSLARMGAHVTGIDFSNKAIKKANELKADIGVEATFVCTDVYSLKEVLDQKFDIVFTSYGTIGWLPDLDKWANIVSHFLKPNGEFIFAEFHPVVWMFDDKFKEVAYNYFNDGPIVETIQGTYTDREADLKTKCVFWNHAMSEVVTSLLNAGLRIDSLNEFDYSPYNCFENTVEFEQGKFRIEGMENRLPMVYSIQATKASN